MLDVRHEASLREQFFMRDPSADGRFVAAVTSTGIYCRPTCPARRPRPDRVRIFLDGGSARAAGYRPCRRCRPDGVADTTLLEQSVMEVAREAAADPAQFPDVTALGQRLGLGRSRLVDVWRWAFHESPQSWLTQRRLDRAAGDLLAGRRPLAAAQRVGVNSLSSFHEGCLRYLGMTPGALRRLGERASFRVAVPSGYDWDQVLNHLVRDGGGAAEARDGDTLEKAYLFPSGPGTLVCRGGGSEIEVVLEGSWSGEPSPDDMRLAHQMAARLLAWGCDPGPFVRKLRRLGHGGLLQGRPAARWPLTADLFEAVVWTVLGQQVNLTFAQALRTAVILNFGQPAPRGLTAHPRPVDLARLAPERLRSLRISGQKSRVLVGLAQRMVADGEAWDLSPHVPVSRWTRRILECPGLGPWSAGYLLMRGLGFQDCVPVGDSALTESLRRYFLLSERPDAPSTQALMAPFAPFRSWATLHFWRSLLS